MKIGPPGSLRKLDETKAMGFLTHDTALLLVDVASQWLEQ